VKASGPGELGAATAAPAAVSPFRVLDAGRRWRWSRCAATGPARGDFTGEDLSGSRFMRVDLTDASFATRTSPAPGSAVRLERRRHARRRTGRRPDWRRDPEVNSAIDRSVASWNYTPPTRPA